MLEYISHHGVLGQRWGVRNDDRTIYGSTSKIKKYISEKQEATDLNLKYSKILARDRDLGVRRYVNRKTKQIEKNKDINDAYEQSLKLQHYVELSKNKLIRKLLNLEIKSLNIQSINAHIKNVDIKKRKVKDISLDDFFNFDSSASDSRK